MRLLYALAMAILINGPCYAEQLRAGFAKEDITPTEPVQMGGYSLRDGLSEGVHQGDRLFVRALCFNDGTASVLFVESDLIDTQETGTYRERLAAATGIPKDHILCGDAHNHSAPSRSPTARRPSIAATTRRL